MEQHIRIEIVDLKDLVKDTEKEQHESKEVEADLTKKQTAPEEKKRTARRRVTIDAVFSIVYSVLFMYIVFSQFQIDQRFKVYNSLRTYFGFEESDDIELSQSDFLSNFGLLAFKTFRDKLWLWDKKYEIFTNFRFTARRVKLVDYSDSILYENFTTKFWATDYIANTQSFDPDVEDNQTYGKYEYKTDHSTYLSKGGYSFNVQNNLENPSEDEILNFLENFQKSFNEFYDENICTLTLDFLLVNYELQFVMPVVITYNFAPSALIKVHFDLHITDRAIYSNTQGNIRAIIEIIFVMLTVAYILFIVYESTRAISHKFEEINNKDSMFSIEKIIIIKDLVLEYFSKNFLLLIQIISLIITIIAVILWITYILVLSDSFAKIEIIFISDGDYNISDETRNEFIQATKILEEYRSIVTVNFLFLFMRSIKILSNMIKSTSIFINTITLAVGDLVSFFVLFIVVLLGFSIFTFLFYGRFIHGFGVLIESVEQNLSFIMGSIDPEVFGEMIKFDKVISLIFFVIIIYFVKYILIKILVAIILHFYKICLDEYEGKEIEAKCNQIYSKKKIGRSPLIQMINGFKYIVDAIFNLLGCQCVKKKTPAEKQNIKDSAEESKTKNSSQEEILMHDDVDYKNVKNIALFNITYSEEHYYYLRKPFFDSKNDEVKLKMYYESIYIKVFVNSIIYILFIVSIIVSLLLQMNTPWRGLLHMGLLQEYNSPYFPNPENNLDKLITIPDISNFLYSTLPMSFKKFQFSIEDFKDLSQEEFDKLNDTSSYFILRYNQLLQSTILYTSKKTFYNTELGFSRNDSQRGFGDLDIFAPMHLEDTERYTLGEKFIYYNIDQSYRQMGGYVTKMNLSHYHKNPEEAALDPMRNFLIDNYASFFIAEMMLYNIEYKMMAYVEIIFKLDYGTYYTTQFNTYTFKRSFVDSYLDVLKLIFEFIFIVVLFYQIIVYFYRMVQISKSYDKWYRENVKSMSVKVQELRDYYTPELFRKLYHLFNFRNLFEFFILVLCLFLLYLRIIIHYSESQMSQAYSNNEINTRDIYEIRQIVYTATDNKYFYQIIGVIVLFFTSIRMIVMIKLGKYFSILIKTIKSSQSLYSTFIMVFTLVLLAFIFYSHISFGNKSKVFFQLPSAIMFNVNIIFGNLDADFLSQANSLFGPIYFFLFVFSVDMILLNLFLAIIDASYVKVKSVVQQTIEKWSFMRIVCFCCFKKRESQLQLVKNDIEIEYQKEKLFDTFDNKFDIKVKRIFLEKWIDDEVDDIVKFHYVLNKNKQKLKKIELGYNATIANEYNMFDNDIFKGVKEKHYLCSNNAYLFNLLYFVDDLENEILTIEEYKEHLIAFNKFRKIEEQTEKIKEKNNSLYPEHMSIKEQLADNLSKVEEMKRDLEKINSLSR